MKIWIASDLHTDISPLRLDIPAARPDVIVVAGDVSTPLSRSVAWLGDLARQTSLPILAVAGNHEYHGTSMPSELLLGRQLAREAKVHLLEEDVTIINGVRFLGCTLWTDYELYGDPPTAMRHAAVGMLDHQMIRTYESLLRPDDARALHRRSRIWLDAVLAETFDGPTVVVTHHAPHTQSISPMFAGSPTNPAFASDLTLLIERHQPDLWIHGHVHAGRDYGVGQTRVICNPRGHGAQNPEFDPGLIVEVTRPARQLPFACLLK
ncbi:MAG: putative metallophosphoesterase [Microvirga sp.]|nr:putative metallophosphoesterase [Microvirga sp.]